MKAGRPIPEFAAEIMRQATAKRDYRVNTGRDLLMEGVNATDDGPGSLVLYLQNLEGGTSQGTELQVNSLAHQQIAKLINIPKPYYDRMLRDKPQLLAQNVNTWFREAPGEQLVRTMDGKVRAVLSNRYNIMDNVQIANICLPILSSLPEARIESCEITESSLYIKAVNPRVYGEVSVGDVVQAGVLITNSEVGLGSWSISPLIYRLSCLNGMVRVDEKVSKHHIGRINETDMAKEIFADDTKMVSDQAFSLQMRDVITAAVDQVQFGQVLEKLRRAKSMTIEPSVSKPVTEAVCKEWQLGVVHSDPIIGYLAAGGDLSLYGLSNAVTRHAQDLKSYDASTDLEKIGYQMMDMAASSWSRLSNPQRYLSLK